MTKLSDHQKDLLLNFMESHPELVSAKFTANFTFKHSTRLWETIARALNSCSGAKKTASAWRKTWHDLFRLAKVKYAKIKESQEADGDQSSQEILTGVQERIIALLEAKRQQQENGFNVDPETSMTKNVEMMENFEEQHYATVRVLDLEPGCSKSEVFSVVLHNNEEPAEHSREQSPTLTFPAPKQCRVPPAEKRLPRAEDVAKRFCGMSEKRLALKKEALVLQKEKLKQDKEKLVIKRRAILAKEATAAALERIALALEIRNELL